MASDNSWQPSAHLNIIRNRAKLLQDIRAFMDVRGVIEVDTPILSHYAISDPYIQSLTTSYAAEKNSTLYLHTSPEFCMKRLLAAGSGAIYQFAHVFRNEESGRQHNTEFTMLEWYRPEFDYHQLMNEVNELLVHIGLKKADKLTYAELFQRVVQLNPHTVDINQLQALCQQAGWDTVTDDRHALLDFVFSEIVIKQRKNNSTPLIVYDYPECMSALSTLKAGNPVVSERFELFINGMEIANGFNELTDADEQLQRFENDLGARKKKGLTTPPVDKNFIDALKSGLPECAGVAMGIERLLMVLFEIDKINEVTTFSLERN
jgi:lysyl-tRNA synthetase class 2